MMKLVPGMLLEGGGRVLDVVDDMMYLGRPGNPTCCTVEDAPPPDLTDRATFLLALDELARRCGLDPTGGVLWYRTADGWWLEIWDGGLQCCGGADTNDPLIALRAALEATK